MVASFVNLVKITELYTWNGWFLHYVKVYNKISLSLHPRICVSLYPIVLLGPLMALTPLFTLCSSLSVSLWLSFYLCPSISLPLFTVSFPFCPTLPLSPSMSLSSSFCVPPVYTSLCPLLPLTRSISNSTSPRRNKSSLLNLIILRGYLNWHHYPPDCVGRHMGNPTDSCLSFTPYIQSVYILCFFHFIPSTHPHEINLHPPLWKFKCIEYLSTTHGTNVSQLIISRLDL